MAERLMVGDDMTPRLPRHAKLRFDKPRDQWIILAPERVFELDNIAYEIVCLCDGDRTVATIINALAEKFEAPRDVIQNDVIAMLQGLADKGFIVA